jgi:hypothetical protein
MNAGRLRNGNRSGDPSKAPRCGARARTRGGLPCRQPAVRGKRRCRMHGGVSTGPRTPEGLKRSQRARWKHGNYSAAMRLAVEEANRELRRQWFARFGQTMEQKQAEHERFIADLEASTKSIERQRRRERRNARRRARRRLLADQRADFAGLVKMAEHAAAVAKIGHSIEQLGERMRKEPKAYAVVHFSAPTFGPTPCAAK